MSHDRYFVNQVADHLIVVEPGRVLTVDGNYEAYQLFLKSKAAAPTSKSASKSAAGEVQQSERKSKAGGRESSSAAPPGNPATKSVNSRFERRPISKPIFFSMNREVAA